MKPAELQHLLDALIADWEGECVEFKDANDSYSTPDIGKYFSALVNEANLHAHCLLYTSRVPAPPASRKVPPRRG